MKNYENCYKYLLKDYLNIDDYIFIEKYFFNKNINILKSYKLYSKRYKNLYEYKIKDFESINDKILLKKIIKNFKKINILYIFRNSLNDNDNLECLKYYLELNNNKLIKINNLINIFLKKKFKNTINYLVENNYIKKNSIDSFFVYKYNNFETFLRLSKLELLKYTRNFIYSVCGYGNIEYFKFIIENNLLNNNYYALRYIVLNNHIKCLEYLYNNNKIDYIQYLESIDSLVCYSRKSNKEVIEYLISKNFRFTRNFYIRLLDIRNDEKYLLKCLKYGYNQNNQILCDKLMTKAIKNNYLEIVKYLIENNCPLCLDIIYNCSKNNNINILIYFFEEYKLKEKVNIGYDKKITLNYLNNCKNKNLCYDYLINNT